MSHTTSPLFSEAKWLMKELSKKESFEDGECVVIHILVVPPTSRCMDVDERQRVKQAFLDGNSSITRQYQSVMRVTKKMCNREWNTP